MSAPDDFGLEQRMPTIPPLHTEIPAVRTLPSVSSRSSRRRVVMTRS